MREQSNGNVTKDGYRTTKEDPPIRRHISRVQYPTYRVPSYITDESALLSPTIATYGYPRYSYDEISIPSYHPPTSNKHSSSSDVSQFELLSYTSPDYPLTSYQIPDESQPAVQRMQIYDIPSYNLRRYSPQSHSTFQKKDSVPQYKKHYPKFPIPRYQTRSGTIAQTNLARSTTRDAFNNKDTV